jgi:hypothetical protein
MIESVIFMSSSPFFRGGVIGDMFFAWEQAGFFSYLLPFLLIFALVFGVMSKIQIFKENRAINGIIALVVALMALQFSFVSTFFSEIFPRVGIGLSILLVILIFTGLFMDPEKNALMYTMLGIGGVIVVVILIQTSGAIGWSSTWWWYQNWPLIAGVVFVLAIVGIIVGASSTKTSSPSNSPLARALRGQ